METQSEEERQRESEEERNRKKQMRTEEEGKRVRERRWLTAAHIRNEVTLRCKLFNRRKRGK